MKRIKSQTEIDEAKYDKPDQVMWYLKLSADILQYKPPYTQFTITMLGAGAVGKSTKVTIDSVMMIFILNMNQTL